MREREKMRKKLIAYRENIGNNKDKDLKGAQFKTSKDQYTYLIFFFLFKITKKIEVISDNINMKYTFPARPECFRLQKSTTSAFMKNMEVTDSGTKMKALLKDFKTFKIEMNHNTFLYRHRNWWYYLSKESRFAFLIAF